MYWCKQLTHLTTYVIWIAFWIPKEHVHPISEMRVERQALQQNLMVKGMNKKTGIARACQSIWKDGRDLRTWKGFGTFFEITLPIQGIEPILYFKGHYDPMILVRLFWSYSRHTYLSYISYLLDGYISFSSFLLFLILGSPLIRFTYYGPKFTTPGLHYRIKIQDLKLMEKWLLLKFGDLCSLTQVWILIKF